MYLNFGVSSDDQSPTSSYQLCITLRHCTSGATSFQYCATFCPTLKSSEKETFVIQGYTTEGGTAFLRPVPVRDVTLTVHDFQTAARRRHRATPTFRPRHTPSPTCIPPPFYPLTQRQVGSDNKAIKRPSKKPCGLVD